MLTRDKKCIALSCPYCDYFLCICCLLKVKIWFQNRRMKQKRRIRDKLSVNARLSANNRRQSANVNGSATNAAAAAAGILISSSYRCSAQSNHISQNGFWTDCNVPLRQKVAVAVLQSQQEVSWTLVLFPTTSAEAKESKVKKTQHQTSKRV